MSTGHKAFTMVLIKLLDENKQPQYVGMRQDKTGSQSRSEPYPALGAVPLAENHVLSKCQSLCLGWEVSLESHMILVGGGQLHTLLPPATVSTCISAVLYTYIKLDGEIMYTLKYLPQTSQYMKFPL